MTLPFDAFDQAKYYDDEIHSSIPLISEYDAFSFLYRKIPVKMEIAQLRKFEGTYTDAFIEDRSFSSMSKPRKTPLLLLKAGERSKMRFVPVGEEFF